MATGSSILENFMDRGAWWATVHRVTENWTRLKQLSTQAHNIKVIIPKVKSPTKPTFIWLHLDTHTKLILPIFFSCSHCGLTQ